MPSINITTDSRDTVAQSSRRAELIFVDTSVEHDEPLIAALLVQTDGDRHVTVHMLDKQRDGIGQISKVLAVYQDVDAIHFVSHGTDGAIQLGSTWLQLNNLHAYARAIEGWQEALSREADLLFYGCNLAGGAQGQTLLHAISTLSSADVAASADATGHAWLGGDWVLEYAVGRIEADMAISKQLQAHWVSVLDMATFQDGVSAYMDTRDTELDESSPDNDNGGNSEIELDDNPVRLGLIRFDNIFGSGPNQIPVGATINSATLTVSVSGPSVSAANITLHRMLVNWTESSTWNSMGGGVQRNDVEASSMPDSILPNPDQTGVQTFSGLEATLQAWSDGNANHGWVIVNDNDQPWKFYASDEPTVGFRPVLTVDYTPGITVTNTNDAGIGSLRQAIIDANALGGANTITFNIPRTDPNHYYYKNDGVVGSLSLVAVTTLDDAAISDFDPDYPGTPHSWYTISPTSALPIITDTVIIDGYTQLGAQENTVAAPGLSDAVLKIEINGDAASGAGLFVTQAGADSNEFRGLVMNGNFNNPVLLTSNDNIVAGNYIGTDVTGTQLPINPINNHGILIQSSGQFNTIGGAGTGEGNVIAYHTESGVRVDADAGTGNAVLGNSIFANDATAPGSGLGIDLGADGVTVNDVGDGDTGANNLQNFPVLTSANTDGAGNFYVGGVINSTADRTFRIEFFVNSAPDPSGYGEGETYLGFTTTATDLSGNAAFSAPLPALVPVGSFITATATDLTTFDTSEFSAYVTTLDMSQLVVDTTSDVPDAPDTSSITALLSNRGTDNLISLREAILATNRSPNGVTPDEIHFNIPDIDPKHVYYQDDSVPGSLSLVATTRLNDAAITDFDPDYPYGTHSWFTIDLDSAQPQLDIADAVLIDGYTQPGAWSNTLNVGDNARLKIELTDSDPSDDHQGLMIIDGGDGSTIRGLVINAFQQSGIMVESGADGNTIQGNFLGTDITGTIGNGNGDGIELCSDNNVVGGAHPEDRNVFSSNAKRGLATCTGSGTADNLIENNYIGTDVTGTQPLGNADQGMSLDNLHGATIRNNVMANNGDSGILLQTATAAHNIIEGNLIGTDATGTAPLGNASHGICISNGAHHNTLGGTVAGSGNLIAFNNGDGISLKDSGTAANAIRANRMFSNSGLGIDLNNDNVTPNDLGDGDSGANELQNFPVITSAVTNEVDTIAISGTLNSLANTNFDIDFFYNPGEDSQGHTYLGGLSVATDASGNASFINVVFSPVAVSAFEFITATATVTSGPETGNTSEFSETIQADTGNLPPMATIDLASYAVTESVPLPLHGTGLSVSDPDAGANPVRVTLSVDEGILTVAAGTTGVNVTGSGASVVTLNGALTPLNNLLAGSLDASIIYQAIDVPNASTTLTLDINDLGHSGGGGPFSDNDTATLTITAENNRPSATITPSSYAVAENTSLILHGTGLSVADPDAGANLVHVTLSVGEGILTVAAGTTGVTIAGSSSARVTLEGTLTQLNDLLAGNLGATLTYDVLDAPSTHTTLSLDIDDLGHTGSGRPLTHSDNATINISSFVNDAPTATITPASYAVAENTPLILHGAGLAVSDPDAGPHPIRATLAVGEGALTVIDGATGVTVSGSGTTHVILDGALDQLNALLAGNLGASIAYQALDNPSASTSFTLAIDDLGHSGTGGMLTASDNATLTITADNDNPSNTGSLPTDVNVTEDVATHVDLSAIDLSDADAGTGNLTLTLSTSTGGTLLASSGGGVTVGSPGTGTLLLDGVMSSLNAFLDDPTNIQYLSAPDAMGHDADRITAEITDNGNSGAGGGGTISLGSINVDIAPGSDPPQATHISTVEDTQSGPIGLDRNANDGAEVTHFRISNIVGGTLYHHDGVTVINDGAFITVAQGNAGLRFTPIPNSTDPGSFDMQASLSSDNSGLGDGMTTAMVTVHPVNDAPNATIAPASYAAAGNTPLMLHGTGLMVSDPDAGATSVRVTLSVGEGILTVSAGSTGVAVSGSGSASVILDGPLSQINDLLAGNVDATLAYQALDAPSASTILTLAIDDLGNTGSGGSLHADDTATLTITAESTTSTDMSPSDSATHDSTNGSSGSSVNVPSTTTPASGDTVASTPGGGFAAAQPALPEPERPEAEDERNSETPSGNGTTVRPAPGPAPASQAPNASDRPAPPSPRRISDNRVSQSRDTGNRQSARVSSPAMSLGTSDTPSLGTEDATSARHEAGRVALEARRREMEALQPVSGNLHSLFQKSGLLQNLDALRDEIRQDASFGKTVLGSTLFLITSLSVGYVLWLVRGGMLLSSPLSSLPAWRLIDPLPVLATLDKRSKQDVADDDSLESVIRKGAAPEASSAVRANMASDRGRRSIQEGNQDAYEDAPHKFDLGT